jgi:hypothetical protein
MRSGYLISMNRLEQQVLAKGKLTQNAVDRRRLTGGLLLLPIIFLFNLPASLADSDPELKSDTPKMDFTVPQSSTVLKGGVQHQESVATPKPSNNTKPLNGNATNNTGKTGLGKLGFLKGKTDKQKPFKAKLSNDTLSASAQQGVGIIGVKFILAFGRPPVINRVFPGTPSWDAGLRNGDVIVAVDGVPTFGLTKEEVYNMIVGLPNTQVTVSVSRNGEFIAKQMSRMDFNDLTDPIVRRDYLMSM